MVAAVTQTKTTAARRTRPGLPAVRIGLAAGITGMLCCVGPTVLALIGVVSAGTAFVWATDLYHGYGWWFRGGGLLLLVGLAVGVAVATYALLYAVTTSLGTFA
jgi:hypothetical protein